MAPVSCVSRTRDGAELLCRVLLSSASRREGRPEGFVVVWDRWYSLPLRALRWGLASWGEMIETTVEVSGAAHRDELM